MPNSKKFIIAPEIIESTECDKDFVCLTDRPIYCSVSNSLGQTLVRLACDDLQACRHNRTYGALHLCNCQVRNEIFRKYGL